MYRLLLILLICISCTPLQRLQRLQKDAPELFKSRIDTVLNTITIAGSTLSLVGYNYNSSTIVNNNMKIIYTPGKDNTFTVNGECLDKIATVPSYNTFNGIDVENYIKERVKQILNKYKLAFAFVIIFITLVYVIIKYIRKHI